MTGARPTIRKPFTILAAGLHRLVRRLAPAPAQQPENLAVVLRDRHDVQSRWQRFIDLARYPLIHPLTRAHEAVTLRCYRDALTDADDVAATTALAALTEHDLRSAGLLHLAECYRTAPTPELRARCLKRLINTDPILARAAIKAQMAAETKDSGQVSDRTFGEYLELVSCLSGQDLTAEITEMPKWGQEKFGNRAMAELYRLLNDTTRADAPIIRLHAARAIVSVFADSLSSLQNHIRSDSPEIRLCVVLAMRRYGRTVLPYLRMLEQDDVPMVATTATRAIQEIATPTPIGEA